VMKNMYHKVSLTRVLENEIDTCVKKAIDLVGGFNPKENSRIVIKPNLCTARRRSVDGVTTDVRVVDAIIGYIKERTKNCELTIIESQGERGVSADTTFKFHGYNKLVEKYGVHLCNLNDQPKVEMKVSYEAKRMKTIKFPKILLSMNHFISVAKMKRHVMERYSGVWKNQYGLITNRELREKLHPFLPEVLFHLNGVFRPDLSVVDGLTGLEGTGPIEGTPKRMDVIICSRNPLSADIVTAKIIGENARAIPHIKYAISHGFGDAKNVVLVGDPHIIGETRFQFISRLQYMRQRFYLYRDRIRTRNVL